MSVAVTRPVCCMLPHKHVGWFGSQKGGTQDSSVMLENVTRYTQLSGQGEMLPASCCSHLSFGDFCVLALAALLSLSNAETPLKQFWKVLEHTPGQRLYGEKMKVAWEKDDDALLKRRCN